MQIVFGHSQESVGKVTERGENGVGVKKVSADICIDIYMSLYLFKFNVRHVEKYL